MKRVRRLISVLAGLFLMALVCLGQASPGKKEYTFHGKVETVNRSTKSLIVNGERVEEWMDAMTMSYKVDDPSIIDMLKPGERITATVYAGDYTLHKVRLMGQGAGDSKSKK
jgi:Cu/Ag efflux protein CusF